MTLHPTEMPKPNLKEDLESMRRKYNFSRKIYTSKLGALFHHKSAVDLAKLSLNPNYACLIEDYINIVCLPEFKQKYKEERQRAKESQLAEKIQTQQDNRP